MALEKASITNLQSGEQIAVMFNPAEYTLEMSNSFAEIGIPGLKAPPLQYVRGNSRQLKMELFFDVSNESNPAQRDVRLATRRLTALIEQDRSLRAPPPLLFAWGGFTFRCVIESISQRFTLFHSSGAPVRATLTVSFKEFNPVEIETRSGYFPSQPTLRTIATGETLSKIAGEVLGDPTAWREIAELNNLDNPFDLPAGMRLQLPDRLTMTKR
ncbi:MAG: LysM peptidoglycan-binding domain-containing protein [Caldilineaceae bacterium]